MKSTDVTFKSPPIAETIPTQAPTAPVVTNKPTALAQSSQTVAGGLAHHAPTVDQQQTPNVVSLLVDQKDPPHRRGRTAALRVKDVKNEFGVAQRKAFKPVVDLIGPLHDLMAQFKGKV